MSRAEAKRNILAFASGSKAEVVEGLTPEETLRWASESKESRRNLDDSFYICDLGEVANKYAQWKDLFPGIRPFYAVKAAPHLPLIESLAAMGTGFDCASQEEMDMALNSGALPDDIVYANPNKMISHILYARSKGIKLTVFDTLFELQKMKKYYPESELLLRIQTDTTRSVFPDPYLRFGATLEQSRELLREAKELNLDVVGLCFHIGSGCNDALAFVAAFRDAREVFDFANKLGFVFSVLDIGGGFPGKKSKGYAMEDISKTVNKCLNDMLPSFCTGELRVISEPGRYFATTPFTLATSVVNKDIKENSDVDVVYVINEGLHGSFRVPTGIREPYVFNESSKKSKISRVFGPTCDSGDLVLAEKTLPDLDIGDWLFWRNAGCYTFCLSNEFNGFKARVIYNVISKGNESVFYRLCGGKVQSIAVNDDAKARETRALQYKVCD